MITYHFVYKFSINDNTSKAVDIIDYNPILAMMQFERKYKNIVFIACYDNAQVANARDIQLGLDIVEADRIHNSLSYHGYKRLPTLEDVEGVESF